MDYHVERILEPKFVLFYGTYLLALINLLFYFHILINKHGFGILYADHKQTGGVTRHVRRSITSCDACSHSIRPRR